jgi:nucleoside-diphosphate-sugar epimerase
MNGAAGASAAISTGVSGGLNALKACAKTSSVQRFVFTSSSIAAHIRGSQNRDGEGDVGLGEGKQPAFHSQRDRESGVLSSIRSSYTDTS